MQIPNGIPTELNIGLGGPIIGVERNFGSPGILVETPDRFDAVSQQGFVGADSDSVYYRDGMGRLAFMKWLKPEERDVLVEKHSK